MLRQSNGWLLERLLAERDCGFAIGRRGRGRFRFRASSPLMLREEAAG